MQIRIRWARTDYVEGSNEAFFSEKERNLIEFPGYVYHCHFLPHEDNEMMRPIMLQPSGREETANWDEEFIKLNEKAKSDQGASNCKNKVGLRKWKVFRRFKRRVSSD